MHVLTQCTPPVIACTQVDEPIPLIHFTIHICRHSIGITHTHTRTHTHVRALIKLSREAIWTQSLLPTLECPVHQSGASQDRASKPQEVSCWNVWSGWQLRHTTHGLTLYHTVYVTYMCSTFTYTYCYRQWLAWKPQKNLIILMQCYHWTYTVMHGKKLRLCQELPNQCTHLRTIGRDQVQKKWDRNTACDAL